MCSEEGRKRVKGKVRNGLLKTGISRIGSYAIASSVTDHCVTCTTFNILALNFNRLDEKDQSCRESSFRANWLARSQRILDWLLCERSSIICLQEFWVGNEELVNMYETRLGDAGYDTFQLARTNNRGMETELLSSYMQSCWSEQQCQARDIDCEYPLVVPP